MYGFYVAWIFACPEYLQYYKKISNNGMDNVDNFFCDVKDLINI